MPQETPETITQIMRMVRLAHMRRASEQYKHASEFCDKIVDYYADIAACEADFVHTAAKRIERDFKLLRDQYTGEIDRLAGVIEAVKNGDDD